MVSLTDIYEGKKLDNPKEALELSEPLCFSLDNLLKEGADSNNVTVIKIDKSIVLSIMERLNMMSFKYGDILTVQSVSHINVKKGEKIVQLRWGVRHWDIIAPFDGYFIPTTTYGHLALHINESNLSSVMQ
jgi:hypothetical protein